MVMKAVVVYNPRSGSALPIKEFIATCRSHDIDILQSIDVTHDPANDLKPYLSQKNTIVIGYGGDGTLNSVAALVCSTSSVFAPIPGGTLNHFTKDLNIPQELDGALANLTTATIRHIDVGMVNDRLFLNNSSIGFYPATLKMRDELERGHTGKWVAAVLSNIRAFMRYRRMQVEVNGETLKTPFVFIGNNDYKIEQQLIGGRTKLTGNMLSSYAILSQSRWGLFMLFVKSLFGAIGNSNDVKIWKSKQLVIRHKKSHVSVSLDGERTVMETPLMYSVKRKSLYVLA